MDVRVDVGWVGYLGDKGCEPIIGCQASAVPFLLKNETANLHEGVVDGGYGVGCVCVCVSVVM